jgi:23S rRNA pseudouridine2605 synthase
MTTNKNNHAQDQDGLRLDKVLARAGVCSRREAHRLVEEGRVTVNGIAAETAGLRLSGGEKVALDGEKIPDKQPARLWRYHKPVGLMTTHHDPQGRGTVFEHLPDSMPRVISVGRLDLNTEGLLLLTNDGELAHMLEMPSTGWVRRYRVRVRGRVTQKQLDSLKDGIEYNGMEYGPIQATLDRDQEGANAWITIGIKEGKNREVRNIMESQGWEVSRLIRTSYGPFQLGTLKRGVAEEVKGKVLREQLGNKFKL